MIDFSTLPRKNKAYAGANGSKISVVYNGEQYMLKFPPIPRKNLDMSYTNSCIHISQNQYFFIFGKWLFMPTLYNVVLNNL